MRRGHLTPNERKKVKEELKEYLAGRKQLRTIAIDNEISKHTADKILEELIAEIKEEPRFLAQRIDETYKEQSGT